MTPASSSQECIRSAFLLNRTPNSFGKLVAAEAGTDLEKE
jgi:hypothetical protein